MTPLRPEEIRPLLERFVEFGDAVIPKVQIRAGTRGTTIYFMLEAIDNAASADGRWAKVEFALEGVSEFCLRQAPNVTPTFIVFSGAIAWIDRKFFIGFDHHDSTSGIEDYRKSDFYAVCDTLLWSSRAVQQSDWSHRSFKA